MNFDEFLQPGIFGLTGKPGAGKSYFSTRCIVEEIKDKNRPIVTNVPINRQKMRDFVQKDFYLFDLETFTDNRHFFTKRGSYHMEIPEEADKETLDFSNYLETDDEGVLFVIDEAHLYFNSRNWKFMSQLTLAYITFIRHIGDSLIWMCQSYGDIDKQFRGKTQTFHVLRNLNREKWGIFKRGTGFKCSQYLEEAHIESRGRQNERVNQEFTYPFQMKYAELYSTSLFNKTHDQKNKIKGIPVKYPIAAAICLFLGLLYFIATGGVWKMVGWVMPSMAKIQEENISASNLTSAFMGEENQPGEIEISPSGSDPFGPPQSIEEIPLFPMEYPQQVFSGMFKSPFGQVPEEEAERLNQYFFGERRYCTLTFITEKESSEKDFNLSFRTLFTDYLTATSLSVTSDFTQYEMSSELFTGFLRFVNDKGTGMSLKTVKVILKENVPFSMKQGYEIPLQTSTAVQGVVQTNFSYRPIGFSLDLVMQKVQGGELLAVSVTNKEVLDPSASVPIMSSFENANIFEVDEGVTYEIADYESQESDDTKGFMRKKSVKRVLRNKVFLTYGES